MDRASELNQRKVFCEIDAEAIHTLTEHKELISSAIPKAIDRYFSRVALDPGALGYYRDAATQSRLKSDLIKHWDIVLDGSYDDAYGTSVFAIGELHAALGPPHWFVSCYVSLLSDVVADVMASFPARLFGDGIGRARLAGAIVRPRRRIAEARRTRGFDGRLQHHP